jgi:UDP-glucose 4-epimerase
MHGERFFVVGGAGFIGSHLTDRLLDEPYGGVTLFDNFSSGRAWHFERHLGEPRLTVVRGDVKDPRALREAMAGHDVVVHLASNADIARAAAEPEIDFREGTALTQQVLEAMRVTGVRRLLYASGSGVYGDLGGLEAREDHGPLAPTSTYGASKLAGEALISSYCAMFGLTACVFRLGNVVGSRQTHGVGYDFVHRLLEDPRTLRILGDGAQSKSFVSVHDVLSAMLLAHARARRPIETFNVATGDYVMVREIADLTVACLGLPEDSVEYRYSGGPIGWKGDVPVVRLNTDRIRALGWRCERPTREALREALTALIADARVGRLR